MSTETLAQLYCDYKIRLGKSFYYSDVLQKRYADCDQVAVLREEFARWFGSLPSGAKLGGEVARLAFLAPAWNKDAISLIEQVRSEGIQQSAGVLKEYATSKTTSRWINEVIARPKQFEVFREAEWIVGTFSPPAKWIDEQPVGSGLKGRFTRPRVGRVTALSRPFTRCARSPASHCLVVRCQRRSKRR
jgi:hypothetical protein